MADLDAESFMPSAPNQPFPGGGIYDKRVYDSGIDTAML